jgi:hypothetical protein
LVEDHDEWCTHLPFRRPPCPVARPLLFGTLFRARVSFLARLRLFGVFSLRVNREVGRRLLLSMSGARTPRAAARTSRFRAASSSARCFAPASPFSRAYDCSSSRVNESWLKTSSSQGGQLVHAPPVLPIEISKLKPDFLKSVQLFAFLVPTKEFTRN